MRSLELFLALLIWANLIGGTFFVGRYVWRRRVDLLAKSLRGYRKAAGAFGKFRQRVIDAAD